MALATDGNRAMRMFSSKDSTVIPIKRYICRHSGYADAYIVFSKSTATLSITIGRTCVLDMKMRRPDIA